MITCSSLVGLEEHAAREVLTCRPLLKGFARLHEYDLAMHTKICQCQWSTLSSCRNITDNHSHVRYRQKSFFCGWNDIALVTIYLEGSDVP